MRAVAIPARCPRCRSKYPGLNLRNKGGRTRVYVCAQCKHEWPVVLCDDPIRR